MQRLCTITITPLISLTVRCHDFVSFCAPYRLHCLQACSTSSAANDKLRVLKHCKQIINAVKRLGMYTRNTPHTY